MEDRQISYRFALPRDQEEVALTLRFDPRSFELRPDPDAPPPPRWTRLEYNQCPNCPLTPKEHPQCPAAARLAAIVPRFERVVSFDRLHLEVRTPERTVSADTTAQQALSSLIGLVMATSGCPRTRFFRLMARFHLPLATEEETTFRAVGAWLMKAASAPGPGVAGGAGGAGADGTTSSGAAADGGAAGRSGESGAAASGLSGLAETYRHLHQVNVAMTRRLGAAGRTDSTLNAVVLLDVFAMAVPVAIESAFEEFRPLLD